ncbi:uncharacterized protein [Littorina saxatilis]|uniref:Uncharacterized protein n=1 Tax=Littorina saxatilis TaxID=31220 RepID=A0AAN9B7D0_9CAEN
MNKRQFKEIETCIILASGSKSTVPAPYIDFWKPKTPEKIVWDKNRTPHRLSMGSITLKKAAKSKLCIRPSQPSHLSAPTVVPKSSRKMFTPSPYPMDLYHTATCGIAASGDDKEEVHFTPLTTLIVKWQQSLHFYSYTLVELKYLFSRFGKVVVLYKVQVNSAVVVYQDLNSARRALNHTNLGYPLSRVTCQWMYPALANPNIFAAVKDHPIQVEGLTTKEREK